MFKNKTTILFDLDGTLIDSVPDLALAVNDMLKTLGRDGFDEDTIRYWVGNGAPMLIKRALVGRVDVKDDEIEPVLFQKAQEIYMRAYHKYLSVATTTYPCVEETLNLLSKRNFKMAIVTNKPYEFVPPLLKGLGIDKYFDVIIGGDSCSEKKPHPDMLECALKQLDSSIVQSVMIGDSKNDMIAANHLGMDSIALTYGYNYNEDISTYSPNVVFDRFDQVVEVLL